MVFTDNLVLYAFLGVASLVLLVALLVSGRSRRLEERLEELAGPQGSSPNRDRLSELAQRTLPKLGQPLMPRDEKERTLLTTRLIHAGLYGRQAMPLYLGSKLLLMVGLPLLAMLLVMLSLLPTFSGLGLAIITGGVGLVGPSFWLDYRKKTRQTNLRRALPDAIDILIICLEGGLSLTAAIARVVQELRLAHPLLGAELAIVQREMQVGYSSGEALRLFGTRCDLEEVRSLSAVVIQAEKYGASLVKALRVHADTLRIKRMQRAEELAQKAVIKVLFPTILCIFPALFLVVLGPAVIQIVEVLNQMSGGDVGSLPQP